MYGSKTSKPTKIIWKQIPGFPKYEASIYGEIRNFKTKDELKLNPVGGYNMVGIYGDHERVQCKVNRLIALTFIPNPDNLPVVDHIDNNKINDHVLNLRWMTYSQNSQAYVDDFKVYRKILQFDIDGNYIKTWESQRELLKEHPEYKMHSIRAQIRGTRISAYQHKWKFDPAIPDRTPDPNEKFEPITIEYEEHDLSNYSISKKGNIINNKENLLMSTNLNESGYVIVSLRCKKKKKPVSAKIHRLLGIMFLENDDPENKTEIDHLDKNRENNDLPNLEWVTCQENNLRAHGKMVKMMDKDTNEVLKIFRCANDAMRYLGIKSHISMSQMCKSKTSHGYKWQFVKKGEKLTLPIEKVEFVKNIFEITTGDIEAVDYTDVY